MGVLESFLCGSWVSGDGNPQIILDAIHARPIASVSAQGLDMSAALQYGRNVGGPALRKLNFHERALILKKLAVYLTERKEEFYPISALTGATRADSWIDIEGGFGTLFVYSSKARRELPAESFFVDGPVERLSKGNTFSGQHICVPLEGVAIHINAFNFPCWGMLEKFAPTFLAGMPSLVKPASASCYLTQALVRAMIDSALLPPGSLQIVCGSLGDAFSHLSAQDVVTFTGSQSTGLKLKNHPRVLEVSTRFNMESDSLNCSILGPDAEVGSAEFDLFIKELVKEMSVKAGQKCTAIRRAIVPKNLEEAVIDAARVRLAKVRIGDPTRENVTMGALINREQCSDVRAQVKRILQGSVLALGRLDGFSVEGADPEKGAFMEPLLLYSREPFKHPEIHSVEAFGPVSTLMGYSELDEAIELSRLGGGSLVASFFSGDDELAHRATIGLAPYHGRILLMNSACANESTGHGSPLPHLTHGGPGRAGGGEELGGIRAVFHYMQRAAIQGSPQRLRKVCNTWLSGAETPTCAVHPFRKYFEQLQVGETLFTDERTITEEDVANFAALSGDYFYVHTDEEAAKTSLFGRRVAHGYFILSATAGLFVDPAPGPVLANYGLENLRFTKPVYFGDRIKARLTCKQKTPKDALPPQGVVAWDVEVTNQEGEIVAVYTILTLVRRSASESPGRT